MRNLYEFFVFGAGIGCVMLIASFVVYCVSWLFNLRSDIDYNLGRINKAFDRIAELEERGEK